QETAPVLKKGISSAGRKRIATQMFTYPTQRGYTCTGGLFLSVAIPITSAWVEKAGTVMKSVIQPRSLRVWVISGERSGRKVATSRMIMEASRKVKPAALVTS